MILVWRQAPRRTGGKPRRNEDGQSGSPNRGQRDNRNRGRNAKGAGKQGKGGGKPGEGGSGGKPRMQAGPRKERDTIDPDSPFAKLAALKEDLKKGG